MGQIHRVHPDWPTLSHQAKTDTDPARNGGQRQTPDRQRLYLVRPSLPLQPTAEIVQAQEKPLDDGVHEDDTEALVPIRLVLEEKIDSSRSGFGAPHSGHFIRPLSLEKTICSNW